MLQLVELAISNIAQKDLEKLEETDGKERDQKFEDQL